VSLNVWVVEEVEMIIEHEIDLKASNGTVSAAFWLTSATLKSDESKAWLFITL
jgi:hypothetical protein